MLKSEIINKYIKEYDYKSYLEIGVQHGINFRAIKCINKLGVEPVAFKDIQDLNIEYLTSNDFFDFNRQKFDIILIDGLHVHKQVLSDIENSLKILNEDGTIICHDMLPENESMQIIPRIEKVWTGDCWKAFAELRMTRTDLNMFTIPTDFGLGIIQKGKQELIKQQDLTWSNFVRNRKEWMNITDIKAWL